MYLFLEKALFSDDSDVEMYETGIFDSDSDSYHRDPRIYTKINYDIVFSESDFIYRFRLLR